MSENNQVDVLDFIKKDKLDNAPKPKENKKKFFTNYIKLTDKRYLDHTLIYKPIKDANGVPYRRINSALELHIKVHDDAGNYKMRNYEIFEDKSHYGPLTPNEEELFNKVMENIYAIRDKKDNKRGWMKVSKVLTIFYAYAYRLLDGENKNVLESPTLMLVTHSSSKLLERFHESVETKNAVYCTESWLRDYYSLDCPGKSFVLKTKKADDSFGFAVVVDFLELPKEAVVDSDKLKEVQQSVKSLDEVRFKAKFDPNYFNEILSVCTNWFKECANETTETPVDSDLDKLQTEIDSGEAMQTSDVPPINEGDDIQPPDPSIQMKG